MAVLDQGTASHPGEIVDPAGTMLARVADGGFTPKREREDVVFSGLKTMPLAPSVT